MEDEMIMKSQQIEPADNKTEIDNIKADLTDWIYFILLGGVIALVLGLAVHEYPHIGYSLKISMVIILGVILICDISYYIYITQCGCVLLYQYCGEYEKMVSTLFLANTSLILALSSVYIASSKETQRNKDTLFGIFVVEMTLAVLMASIFMLVQWKYNKKYEHIKEQINIQ